jgi:uncharacterized protein (DUF2141 family)
MLTLIITLLSFAFNIPDARLSVKVPNLKNTEAPIYMAIYKNNEDFLDTQKMFTGTMVRPMGDKEATLQMQLPKGEYAVAIFQDINGNGELDTNILGIPKEPYGFSKNFKPVFSAPKFKECSITVNSNTEINIKLIG